MIKYLSVLSFLLISISCKQNLSSQKAYTFKTNIRLGNHYYSIYFNREGEGYVVKGKASYYTEPLKIESSDSSEVFKIDSARVLFDKLDKLKEKPIHGITRLGTARAEIYYNGKQIYDAYVWDETFWSIFRPIMEQFPKEFNPFLLDNPN